MWRKNVFTLSLVSSMKMTLKLVPPRSSERNLPFSEPLGSSWSKRWLPRQPNRTNLDKSGETSDRGIFLPLQTTLDCFSGKKIILNNSFQRSISPHLLLNDMDVIVVEHKISDKIFNQSTSPCQKVWLVSLQHLAHQTLKDWTIVSFLLQILCCFYLLLLLSVEALQFYFCCPCFGLWNPFLGILILARNIFSTPVSLHCWIQISFGAFSGHFRLFQGTWGYLWHRILGLL